MELFAQTGASSAGVGLRRRQLRESPTVHRIDFSFIFASETSILASSPREHSRVSP